jgi:hypothetical protein
MIENMMKLNHSLGIISPYEHASIRNEKYFLATLDARRLRLMTSSEWLTKGSVEARMQQERRSIHAN